MGREKVIYFGLVGVVAVLVIVTSFSYAFLIKTEEHHGKLNVVVGTLDYKISSKLLNDNKQITLASNEKAKLNIKIESLNEIDSMYELFYTTTNNNIEIGYTSNGDNPTGTIQAKKTKSINVIVKNTSNSSATITFGITGGFTGNNLTTPSGKTSLVAYNGTYCPYEVNHVFNFDYTGDSQEFDVPCSGNYRVELWGAQGYNDVTYENKQAYGGYGGYTSGIITLLINNKLYFYVGKYGTGTSNEYSYNNGTGTLGGWTGGGSTDIRLINGNWDDFNSIKSRIMVAAGGGTGYLNNISLLNAGGLNGYSPFSNKPSQTSIGSGGSNEFKLASFGKAGGGCTSGNGYYPGNGVYCVNGSAGGSSFISGHNGCDAIAESSTENNIVHTGQPNHYSGYKFTDTKMIDGAGYSWTNTKGSLEQMPNPAGGYYASGVGQEGNGYARITYLGEIDQEESKGTMSLAENILESNGGVNSITTLNTSKFNGISTENGLYKYQDDHGDTYYFRGNVTNNVVSFAGKLWRIIRINGDGTVRLITDSASDTIYGSKFSNGSGNYTYFYYSNNGSIGDSSNPNAKYTVDNWYSTNIGNNNSYSSKIATGSYFCEAVKVKSYEAYTTGNAQSTLYTNYTPNLTCAVDGNGKGYISASAALITYDESILAGAYYLVNNTNLYLYNEISGGNHNYLWWTMSPNTYGSYPAVWYFYYKGMMYSNSTGNKNAVRPVINLRADVTATKNSNGYYVIQ